MRTKLLSALAMVLLCGAGVAGETLEAPDWTLRSTDGHAVTLSDAAAEQPVIVLFWATWCPYCKSLMPHLQSIRLEYGEDIRILAVHFRDDNGDPVAFMERAGYDFTLLPDGGDVAELNDAWGTPQVLVVDRDMRIRFNLYEVPKLDLSAAGKSPSHGKKAAYLAPYWAAELRKSLDLVLRESATALHGSDTVGAIDR